MRKPAKKTTFVPLPIPLKDGGGWYLRAKSPHGVEERINGFQTGDEAMEWLNSDKKDEWLKARGQQ